MPRTATVQPEISSLLQLDGLVNLTLELRGVKHVNVCGFRLWLKCAVRYRFSSSHFLPVTVWFSLFMNKKHRGYSYKVSSQVAENPKPQTTNIYIRVLGHVKLIYVKCRR